MIRSELKPSICDVHSNNTFQEAIFVDCKVCGIETLTIGIVYRSPNSTKENSEELNNLISNASGTYRNLVKVGDFNYPEIIMGTRDL